MKCKKIKMKLQFWYDDQKGPYELDVERLNPSIKQIKEIQEYMNSTVEGEIKHLERS